FNLVHDLKVSNDGLVYVADRKGLRLQVFTIDGKYVAQSWVDRWCGDPGTGCGTPQTAGSIGFSGDPEQRFLYVASRAAAKIWVYDRKTLEPLYSFGRPGVAPGEFTGLHEITTDSKGNIYSAELAGHRHQKFVYKGLGPAPTKYDMEPSGMTDDVVTQLP